MQDNTSQLLANAQEKLEKDIVKTQEILSDPKRRKNISKGKLLELLGSCLQVIQQLPMQTAQLAQNVRAIQTQVLEMYDWMRITDHICVEEELWDETYFASLHRSIIEKPGIAAHLISKEVGKITTKYRDIASQKQEDGVTAKGLTEEQEAAYKEELQEFRDISAELNEQDFDGTENLLIENIIARFGTVEELGENAEPIIRAAKEASLNAAQSLKAEDKVPEVDGEVSPPQTETTIMPQEPTTTTAEVSS